VMLGLARALLHQLNSQRDHFSLETMIHLTSNSNIEVATDQISLIEPDQESVASNCFQRSQCRDEESLSHASSAKELYE